ncbi:MAG: NAD(P)-dependent glycerol-3-phosphate dehydrogenase [Nitrospinae bacterium]|nr:NAD(P)-dependent glycerol-3-phosphate dehydrogenase [Nitrospinota bacterium]
MRYFQNTPFLPGTELPDNIEPTNSLEETAREKDLLLFAVPTHVLRTVVSAASPFIAQGTLLVNAGKGIEAESLATPSQIFQEVLGSWTAQSFCVLSGPTFANEIVRNTPAAATAASLSEETAKIVQETVSTSFFKVFISHDPLGVEIGGALKNVIAIAAGISDGLGFGYNARAFLITRGLAEMMRLGCALGANPQTLAGLSGMGDLILTCTGDLSRNRKVGMELARGKKREEIQREMRMVAEGIKTSFSAYQLLKKLNISAAILEEVYKILYEDKAPKQALADLMDRKIGVEFFGGENPEGK